MSLSDVTFSGEDSGDSESELSQDNVIHPWDFFFHRRLRKIDFCLLSLTIII